MRNKVPYVYANLQLVLKNEPEEYRGLSGERWTIGKNMPLQLRELISDVAATIAGFYGPTTKTDDATVCDEVEAAAQLIIKRAQYVRDHSTKPF